MQIQYFHSLWGMEGRNLEANLRLIKEGGFDGVEMTLPADAEQRQGVRALLETLGLALIAQQKSVGATPQEHLESLEAQYRRNAEFCPLLINAHTGRDTYTTAQNLLIFRRAQELEAEMGVLLAHETHRTRATFSVPATMALLDALPEIKLTADLSHWCCVHESLLEDQATQIERAIAQSYHIHARVGHAEGPQVTDPRAPEWAAAVEAHLGWWQQIIAYQERRGATLFTINPEFGPPGYMVTQPYTRQPIANLWEVTCYMKDFLRERLGH